MDPQTARLPGVRPITVDEWLIRSDSYDAQMAYRKELLATKREAVFQAIEGSESACIELLNMIGVERTDEHPLMTAANHVQEDLCILQKQDEEHILTAAVMCFPSSWDVREKINRSIASIHSPVSEFSPVQSIVERMLSAIRVEQPLGRANFLIYTDPELHQPRGEGVPKLIDPDAPRFVRVERQTFRRLPETLAVVFAIHTYVIPAASLDPDSYAALLALKPDLSPNSLA